ncbi:MULTISPECIES: NACHT domain-containing NTPase [unclassified Vibrio]|uniref:NACHT domain-containing protein n=1 Tax=unclassified Vibrio TaxID=2614977 RepID=UPI00354E4633
MDLVSVSADSAIKKVSGNEASEIVKFIKKKLFEKWSNYAGKKEMECYSEKVVSYFYFYTITNPDKKVFIDEVYVPINMKTSDNIEVSAEKLFIKSRHINVISGVAGHGKSTMLRYLMKKIVLEKESHEIPIFFELKYFRDGGLEQQLCDWLNNNGLSVNVSFLEKLLTDGNLILFFDAFDELPSYLMDTCVSEITKLHQKYPNTSITVTTRPDLQITKNQFSTNYKLMDINREQAFEIILKASGDKLRAQEAIREIYKSKFVSGVIKTPLLAVLINVTYEHWKHLPETMSQFYENVFSTLLRVHDGTKSGKRVDREIGIGLHDYQILEVVYNISYKLGCDDIYEFNNNEFDKLSESILKKKKLDSSNVTPLFRCLTKVCNIVISDGRNNYKFMHKSFQEFYAAKHVEGLHHNKKEQFYSNCLKNVEFRNKVNKTLDFLYEIDQVYFFEYLLVPYLLNEKFIRPYSDDFDVSVLRTYDFSHLVRFMINSKYISKDASIIETKPMDLYFYRKLIDEEYLDEVLGLINKEIYELDLTDLCQDLNPAHKLHRLENMYSMNDIVSKYGLEDKIVNSVLRSFAEQEISLDSVESELEEKLDYFYDQKESSDENDVSDL